ncbi:MAG: family 20 glycosylhydrolase, partial [Melioribacteraceae bacterium]|nr:family 20 glycosylhydrolase [Melioribacteraceae bacterium]
LKYAEERFITIIPEIEMPGHSQAALAAYPELGCTGKQVEVATKWGVFEDIYCSKDETFNFLEGVLDEVIELFPSEYIHIGGDEAPKSQWEKCPNCQKRIEDLGLKDEHELQSYFITRIERYLNSKGRQIIGWDEILEGGLAPNATVMSWRGMLGAIEAAKQGHKVIMTPTSHCYFDYYQSRDENEPLAIGGYLPLEKVYNFNPIPDQLTKEQSNYVLGAQGNVWTEYMPSEKQVEYMVFPRILAMSEVVWSNSKRKKYEDFLKRIGNMKNRLDALKINYSKKIE